MPTVVELLERRWEAQAEEREAAPRWETHVYDGERISLVFTTPTGGLVLRQTVAKVVKHAAKSAGILVDIATHVGRRRVVTLLYVEADEALEDIAHFVGHASQGEHDRRPREAARAASSNGGGAGGSSARRRGRNHSAADASNRASNAPEPAAPSPDGSGR